MPPDTPAPTEPLIDHKTSTAGLLFASAVCFILGTAFIKNHPKIGGTIAAASTVIFLITVAWIARQRCKLIKHEEMNRHDDTFDITNHNARLFLDLLNHYEDGNIIKAKLTKDLKDYNFHTLSPRHITSMMTQKFSTSDGDLIKQYLKDLLSDKKDLLWKETTFPLSEDHPVITESAESKFLDLYMKHSMRKPLVVSHTTFPVNQNTPPHTLTIKHGSSSTIVHAHIDDDTLHTQETPPLPPANSPTRKHSPRVTHNSPHTRSMRRQLSTIHEVVAPPSANCSKNSSPTMHDSGIVADEHDLSSPPAISEQQPAKPDALAPVAVTPLKGIVVVK